MYTWLHLIYESCTSITTVGLHVSCCLAAETYQNANICHTKLLTSWLELAARLTSLASPRELCGLTSRERLWRALEAGLSERLRARFTWSVIFCRATGLGVRLDSLRRLLALLTSLSLLEPRLRAAAAWAGLALRERGARDVEAVSLGSVLACAATSNMQWRIPKTWHSIH